MCKICSKLTIKIGERCCGILLCYFWTAFTHCSSVSIAAFQNVWNLFNVNNKDTTTTAVTSFWCLYCYLWTDFTHCSGVSIAAFQKMWNLFNVDNKDATKTTRRRSGIFIVNFEIISHIVLLFPLHSWFLTTKCWLVCFFFPGLKRNERIHKSQSYKLIFKPQAMLVPKNC